MKCIHISVCAIYTAVYIHSVVFVSAIARHYHVSSILSHVDEFLSSPINVRPNICGDKSLDICQKLAASKIFSLGFKLFRGE